MILIKLADGSVVKVTESEHDCLVNNGSVVIGDNVSRSLHDRVLRHLLRHKKEVTMGRLVNIFRCSHHVMSVIINDLKNNGIVKTSIIKNKYKSDPSIVVSVL